MSGTWPRPKFVPEKNYEQLKEQAGEGGGKKGEEKPNQLAFAISPCMCQGLWDFLLENVFQTPPVLLHKVDGN